MKKKASLAVIFGSIAFAGLIATGSTLGWFNSQAFLQNSENPIEGTVQDKYYASGTGASDDPFVINQPRHLYNLAWLQYLGFYNKSDGGIDDHQFYFVLGDNIDMSAFGAIPPIGTEQNPFIGHFDGQGYVVSNVTITNDFNAYDSHPSAMDGGWDDELNHQQPHILGFFGVVGYPSGNKNTNYSSTVNEFVNTGLTGVTVETVVADSLTGVAAGLVYDSDLTDAHNVLKNIIVDDSSISFPDNVTTRAYSGTSSLTSNLSDYTLVGYTNNTSSVIKASKTTYGVNIDTNITFAASEEGNTAGWGGSIDMLTMFNQLHDIWNTLDHDYASNGTISPLTYYRNKEITINKNGTTTVNSETNATENNMTSATDSTVTSSSGNYNYFSTDTTDTDSKQTSSYSFVVGDAGQSTETRFMCLTGGKTVEVIDGQTLKTNYYETFYGKKIYIDLNGNRYYLKTNGINDVTATTDEDQASLWNVQGTEIYTEIDEVAYYLNRSGTTTVNLGTTSNTIWNYSSENNGYFTTYNNENYYLNCATTDWNLTTVSNVDHVLLSDGNGHYIAHPSGNSNGNATVGTDKNSNTVWWYQNGNYFVSSSGGNRYLRNNYTTALSSNSTNSNQNMYVSNSTNYRFSMSDGYLYATYSARINWTNTTHHVYAYWNGTAWKETIAVGTANPPANRTIIYMEKVGTLADSAKNITLSATASDTSYVKKSRTETVNAPFEVEHTYFPLRSEENKPGVPADTNTGYVVSGGNYGNDEFGDIRVSSYSKSQYLSGGVNTVYTINANGSSVTTTNYGESNFKKYTTAKSAMETVLNGNQNIYGLHFMNASIHYGGTNPVYAEKAIVNGTTRYNYELPTDCIDFNLKENGYINFFAGTYYTNNSCFFSLHEVIRSGSSISDIREIKAVYYDASDASGIKSYSYLYDDGTYSVPFKYTNGVKTQLDGSAYTLYSTQGTCPSGYTLAFDTFRITNRSSNAFSLTSNAAYYFEIPMNEGEYCLGSVSGRNGAYLMYLDIAANASKTNRTIIYERFKLTQSTYLYPTGVALKSWDSSIFIYDDNAGQFNEIDASDSVCMIITTGANGDYGMDREGNDVALIRAQTTHAPPNYSGENIELVHDDGSQSSIAIQAISESTRWIKQMEYLDYMIISDTLVVTTITDISTDEEGTSYVRQSITQKQYGGNSTSGTLKSSYTYINGGTNQISSMKIYNNSGKKYTDAEATNTGTLNIAEAKLRPGTDENIVLVFKLFQNGGSSYTDSSTVAITIDQNYVSYGTYFTYNGFTIVLTPDSGNITIKVISYNGTFTMTTTNTVNSSSSTTTQTTLITINGTTVTGENQEISISQAIAKHLYHHS